MIIEKLLSPEIEDELYNVMTDIYFPWYWNKPNVINKNAPEGQLFQFFYPFIDKRNGYKKSEHFNLIEKIVEAIETKTTIKVKNIKRVNGHLIPRIVHCQEWLDNIVHRDIETDDKKSISVVYYVDDSDGDTLIFDTDKKTVIERSSPIKGNCIIFNSKSWHRASIPIKNKRRIIITFILEVK
jgi:hypothetical protein